MKARFDAVPAGFVSLNPPYTAGFRGHDGAWPSRDRFGFPLPVLMRISCAGLPQRVQRFVSAEGLGVSPNFLISPQEWGPEG